MKLLPGCIEFSPLIFSWHNKRIGKNLFWVLVWIIYIVKLVIAKPLLFYLFFCQKLNYCFWSEKCCRSEHKSVRRDLLPSSVLWFNHPCEVHENKSFQMTILFICSLYAFKKKVLIMIDNAIESPTTVSLLHGNKGLINFR